MWTAYRTLTSSWSKRMTGKEFRICFHVCIWANWYTADQTQNPSLPRKYTENKIFLSYSYKLQCLLFIVNFQWYFSITTLHNHLMRSHLLHHTIQWGSQKKIRIISYYWKLLLCALNILPHLIFTTLSVGKDEETDSETRKNSSKVIQDSLYHTVSKFLIICYAWQNFKYFLSSKEENIGQNI